jgi:arylsulfatase A
VLVHDPFVPTPETIGDALRTEVANRQPKSRAVRKQNFVAMVEYMDVIVGRIVKKVQDAGQEQNTLILFTADNGTNTGIVSRWDGQDIRGGKAGMKDMGTHVPLVASWPGTMPPGVVLDDLIDFTDFYPTLAGVAGVSLTKDDPTDGRSFLPQLQGQPGNPRDWVLCHYQPYWRKQPGQFARTQRFKLYRDGRLYDVPSDLKEERDLAGGRRDIPAHRMLQALLDRCPPSPIEVGSRESVHRPTYAEWPDVLEPGD